MYDFRKLAHEITEAAMTPAQLARRAAYLEQVAEAEASIAAFCKKLGDVPRGVVLAPRTVFLDDEGKVRTREAGQ